MNIMDLELEVYHITSTLSQAQFHVDVLIVLIIGQNTPCFGA